MALQFGTFKWEAFYADMDDIFPPLWQKLPPEIAAHIYDMRLRDSRDVIARSKALNCCPLAHAIITTDDTTVVRDVMCMTGRKPHQDHLRVALSNNRLAIVKMLVDYGLLREHIAETEARNEGLLEWSYTTMGMAFTRPYDILLQVVGLGNAELLTEAIHSIQGHPCAQADVCVRLLKDKNPAVSRLITPALCNQFDAVSTAVADFADANVLTGLFRGGWNPAHTLRMLTHRKERFLEVFDCVCKWTAQTRPKPVHMWGDCLVLKSKMIARNR